VPAGPEAAARSPRDALGAHVRHRRRRALPAVLRQSGASVVCGGEAVPRQRSVRGRLGHESRHEPRRKQLWGCGHGWRPRGRGRKPPTATASTASGAPPGPSPEGERRWSFYSAQEVGGCSLFDCGAHQKRAGPQFSRGQAAGGAGRACGANRGKTGELGAGVCERDGGDCGAQRPV